MSIRKVNCMKPECAWRIEVFPTWHYILKFRAPEVSIVCEEMSGNLLVMQDVHMNLVQLLISISTELSSFYNGVCPIKMIISKNWCQFISVHFDLSISCYMKNIKSVLWPFLRPLKHICVNSCKRISDPLLCLPLYSTEYPWHIPVRGSCMQEVQ
jgi:hypothetical protein